MTPFTVFCRQDNDEGTTWIDTVHATDIGDAKERAIAKCSFDWNYDPTLIRVVGVAAGEVAVLEWNDLVDEYDNGFGL